MTQNKTIVIADYESDFVNNLSGALKSYNFTVYAASDIAEAKELCSRFHPDVVIADMLKHNDDAGIVLAHYLKKNNSKTSVMLISHVTANTGISFNITTESDKKWICADVILDKNTDFPHILMEIEKLCNKLS
jgi:DNA-binding NtrC family response regulator